MEGQNRSKVSMTGSTPSRSTKDYEKTRNYKKYGRYKE